MNIHVNIRGLKGERAYYFEDFFIEMQMFAMKINCCKLNVTYAAGTCTFC